MRLIHVQLFFLQGRREDSVKLNLPGPGKMAQWIKMLASSLVASRPRTHLVRGEDPLPHVAL